MQTVIIDIINNKAIRLLQELERLQLIRMRMEQVQSTETDWAAKYKGTMTKQPLTDVDRQLKELRNQWE